MIFNSAANLLAIYNITRLFSQGEETLDNDFYLKENPDGTVVFESVPNKGRFINVTTNNQTIRNFSITLLVCAIIIMEC